MTKLANIGSAVKAVKGLTIGRWYALSLGMYRETTVHAQYTGEVPDIGHRFVVCQDDSAAARVMPELYRVNKNGVWFASGPHVEEPYSKKPQLVNKFATHPDKVVPAAPPEAPVTEGPKPFPRYTDSKDVGAKVGDRFLVVDPRVEYHRAGDIVELTHDDGSRYPYFKTVVGGVVVGSSYCTRWERLARLPAPVVEEPTAPALETSKASSVAKLTTRIDELTAQQNAKLDEAAAATTEANKIQQRIDYLRTHVEKCLSAYLPQKQ